MFDHPSGGSFTRMGLHDDLLAASSTKLLRHGAGSAMPSGASVEYSLNLMPGPSPFLSIWNSGDGQFEGVQDLFGSRAPARRSLVR